MSSNSVNFFTSFLPLVCENPAALCAVLPEKPCRILPNHSALHIVYLFGSENFISQLHPFSCQSIPSDPRLHVLPLVFSLLF